MNFTKKEMDKFWNLRGLWFLSWRLWLACIELSAGDGHCMRITAREGLVKAAIEVFDVSIATHAV